jgi:hypothetical protein
LSARCLLIAPPILEHPVARPFQNAAHAEEMAAESSRISLRRGFHDQRGHATAVGQIRELALAYALHRR